MLMYFPILVYSIVNLMLMTKHIPVYLCDCQIDKHPVQRLVNLPHTLLLQ